MDILTIQIDGRKYTAGRITAYLTREALKIQADAVKLAKQGQVLLKNTTDLDAAGQLMDDMMSLRDRKVWLLCQVYGNAFTQDELEKALTDGEIDWELNRIINGIAGVVTKN